MGRIKTDMVKRTTGKVVENYSSRFSKSFEKNKQSLNELAEVRSKKLRNVIAGYAVRLKKREGVLGIRSPRKTSQEN
jgi:small subunit ribosomal protein S17e